MPTPDGPHCATPALLVPVRAGTSSIDAAFLWPLGIAVLGFTCIFGGVLLARMRAILAHSQAEARLRRKAMQP